MNTRGKKAGRPRAAPSDVHDSQYPMPSKRLMSLKKTNPKSFVIQMIHFLRRQTCHPDVGVGWWCCFPAYMSHLLTFLADSEGHDQELWSSFRKEVALQLRNCRQCVVKYHEAVSQWELCEQDIYDAEVVKTRVQSLLDWDCERVLPLIKAGADVREGDAKQQVIVIQCREAFFEALVSLRLCTSTNFCTSLGKLFQKRIPARNEEDTLPFIRQLGFVPEGLIALCFHGLPVVQVWALRIYKSSQKGLRVPREPLFFLLRRAMKRLRALQDQVCLEVYLDQNLLERDFAKLEAQWEATSALICTMDEDAIQSVVRRNKSLLPVTIACTGISLHSERIALLSLKVLRRLLRSLPFDCVFDQKSTTAEVFLDSIFLALRKHLERSTIAEKVLTLIGCVLGLVHRNCSASTTSELFKKCLTELYDIAKDASFCSFEVQLEERGASSGTEKNSRVRKSLWKTAAEVLRFFYTITSPSLPLDDAMLISTIVTASLKQDAIGSWSWDLFKCVLLTDVFNVLRSLKTEKDLHVIARTFLEMRPKVGEMRPEEQVLLADVVNVPTNMVAKPTWVGPLWRRVLLGEHLKKTDARNEIVIDREMSILLDLHRLVGVFDSRKVQFVLDGPSSGSTSPQPKREMIYSKDRGRVIELITSVQETISARLRWACSELPGKSWLHHLPFHVAHLLSSARKDIAKRCSSALRTSYGLKDVISVIPHSKLLVQLMKQDERTAEMVVDGFTSSLRTIVVLSDMTSIRTYAVFLQWYRTLLDSEYTALLRDESTLKWTLASVRSFSDNWSGFECTIGAEEFREACCQFFKQLREVWARLYDEVQSKNETGKHQEPALIRGVTQSLFKMHTVKDETVLASWVHTMGSMAEKWAKSREHRTAMSKIITTHANGIATGTGLSHEQCSQLAQAGNLDDVQPVLLAWSRRKETKDTNRNTVTKVYEATKIDQFFERKSGKDSNTYETPGLQSNITRGRSVTTWGMTTMRSRLPLMRAPVKSVKSTGTLSELRKEHTHDGARSKRTKKVRSELQPEGLPKKTYFEIQREKYIARRARDAKESHPAISSPDSENQCSPWPSVKEPQRDAEESSSIEAEVDLEAQDLLRYALPSDVRSKTKRDMDVIYRQLLSSSEPSLRQTGAMGSDNKAFSSTEDYVDFWEPLLIAEYRASVMKMIGEENVFATRFKQDPHGYRYCRTAFEVQEPPSSVGYFHHLSMQLCEGQGGEIKGSRGGFSSSQFSIFDAQPTDIVYLLIPPARCTVGESGDVTESIAFVAAKKVNKGVLQLELRICFDDALETAPGKGRRIQVSRLMSLTTFQRQIEALWLVPFLPDGLLWPILDPSKGFAVNDAVESHNEEASLAVTRFSRDFVSDLKSKGSLNESQAVAINSVLRSAGPLFGYHGSADNEKFFKKNHGALTLIQGPPGTGKTSTIINLLSTLVLTSPNRKYPRMTRIFLEDHSFRIKIPAIRVLVCAPSNAAVDEVMLRVMEHGLPVPGGGRACPRMVRVGHGTTQKRLKSMELDSVAKSENCTDESAELGDAQSRLTGHCRVLREINDRISEVSKERHELITLDETQRKYSQVGTASQLTPQIQSLTEKLTRLHGEKEVLKRYLSRDRDEVKEKNEARKREETKRMCTALNRTTLVFSTLNSAGHELMRSLGTSFDVIIIDEAAQCIEPESLIPMTIGLREKTSSKFTQVVMVGDPKQLPATILSTNPRILRPMGMSLFERACVPDPARVMMLRVQYRMHPAISGFPNKQFYSGLLQDGANVQGDSAFRSFHNDGRRRFGPLTFFDTASIGTEERRTAKGSISNFGEARMVITILKSLVGLYKAENLKNDIVILSPYNHQVNLLKQLVRECVTLESVCVEVSTIDGIQGREKSVVILSTVRGQNSNGIGFVKDVRRMNVALTRAKHSLLIVGDAPVLSRSSPPWYELLKHCRDQDRLIVLPKRVETLFPDRITQDDLIAASRPNQSGRQPFLSSKPLSSVKPIRAKEECTERTPEDISRAKACHTNNASKSPTDSIAVQIRPVLSSVKRPRSCENAPHHVNEVKRMKQDGSSVRSRTEDFVQNGDKNAGAEETTCSTALPVDRKKLSNGESRLAKSGELDLIASKVMREGSLQPSSNYSRDCLESKSQPNIVGGPRKVQDRGPIGMPVSKQVLPLRSNVLPVVPEVKPKTSEVRAAKSIKAMRENATSSQRMTSSSFGPFAPSRRKTEVSPFASKNAAPFVYSNELKRENSNKKHNNVFESGEVRRLDSRSYHQVRQLVSRESQIRRNDHKRPKPAKKEHKIHPQQPRLDASQPRANILSRLGSRTSPGTRRVGYAEQPPASKFGAPTFNPSSNQRVQPSGIQSIAQSVGAGSRSRPLGKFPSVVPGVRKPTSQNYVGSRRWGTTGDGQLTRMPFVGTRSVNHRGFVKKQPRELGMRRANASGQNNHGATTGSEAKSLAEARRASSQPKSRLRPQPRMAVMSEGPHLNDTRPRPPRAQGRREGGPPRQSPAGSLLERLQAGQERTLSMLKRNG